MVHPVDHLSRGLFLGLISVKDGGAVGSSDVIALPVDGCGIVHAEEKIQQVGEVGQLWVESDPESFRVPGMMLVGWVVVLPAGVAAFGIHHPRLAAKQFFHTPEATARKDYLIGWVFRCHFSIPVFLLIIGRRLSLSAVTIDKASTSTGLVARWFHRLPSSRANMLSKRSFKAYSSLAFSSR